MEQVPEQKTTTVISLNRPTPQWATWVFRSVLVITTAASIWLAATGLIKDASKVEALLVLKVIDFSVWTISRFLGVKKEDIQPEML